jgi:Flp pilus assembly protein TadG
MIKTVSGAARRWWKDTSGLAAVEFALILPVMLVSLMGAVEVSNGMLANRKVTMTASTLADLIAQDTNITNAEMSTIMGAAEGVLSPIVTSSIRMRVTSVTADANGKTTVAWSDGRGFAARSKGSAIAVPANIVSPGGSVIFAEVEVRYDSTFSDFFSNMQSTFSGSLDKGMKSGWTLSDEFYLRPRRSISITRTAA